MSQQRTELISRIKAVQQTDFEELAIDLFYYQFEQNPIYRKWCTFLNKTNPTSLAEIPFLPIQQFKYEEVISGSKSDTYTLFESSGTTGSTPSRHIVKDLELYLELAKINFEQHYGSLSEWTIFALLPGYLERKTSSLVAMVNAFIKEAKPGSGFYLDDLKGLKNNLKQAESKVLLIGVTFALLDFIDVQPVLPNTTVVMETGGMKGRKKELIREELHHILKQGFKVKNIHSEYGMTELLSQAYAKKNGVHRPAAQMRVLLRNIDDPFSYIQTGTGGLNIIDLANIDSCCFIETQDLGRLQADGAFEVLGRFDQSEVRGCSLMAL